MTETWLTLLAGGFLLLVFVFAIFMIGNGRSYQAHVRVPSRARAKVPKPRAEAARRPDRALEPPPLPTRRAAGGGVLVAALPAEPEVRRFVLVAPIGGQEREPQLPARVAVGSGWHGSFFHGWCGAAGPRSTSQLVVRGLTMRGATHASLNTEGQDAVGTAWDEARSALYVAVADGVGSLPGSGPAALHAINAALQLCVSPPAGVEFADGGPRLYASIASGLLRTLGAADRLDGACTLVVAEVVPRFDGADVTVHGVGDSEAWALYAGQWTPLHHERGTADNATRALPAHTVPRTAGFHLSPGSVLVLGSDGFAGALDDSGTGLGQRLAGLWRDRPGWLDFVNHVSFVDEYWSDDRSAVAVWIGEGTPDA